jgi:isoquinoline 1-oxidoreductase
VKIVWTREEEFTWAYFRPAGVLEVRSGIGADGKLAAWEFHNYHSGMAGIETPYEVANQLTQYHQVPLVLRCGSYRGLAAPVNHFARETHMDSLARLAAMDPVQFRLANLADARMRTVLETGAKAFAWPREKKEEGQGFGVAAGYEKGSYVATFAEIFADPKARSVCIKQLLEVFECGAIVNPDGLRNQVVGAMIQGLGGALFESIQFQNGRVSNAHFANYRVPRFRDVPEIETILLDRKDIPSAGAGETPIMAIAPAIGNAFYDATKIRLTSLPLQPELRLAT